MCGGFPLSLSLCSKNSFLILSSVLSFYNERQRFGALRSGGKSKRKVSIQTTRSKSQFLFAKLQKKPIKLAFADYEAKTFNLDRNPPFCKTLVMARFSCHPPMFLYASFIKYFVSSKSFKSLIVNSKSPVPKCPISLTSLP